MAVVLYGPSLALSSVTPLSVEISILVVGVICSFYTSIGGIKAVIWTDVLQCTLMLMGLLMVVIQGSIEAGGILKPWEIANEGGRVQFGTFATDIHRNDTFWSAFFGMLVIWSGSYCVTQTQVQRYCSMRSKERARKTLYWNIPPVVAIAVLAVWCGIVIYAKYKDCDPVALKIIDRPDQLMPYFVMETMSHIPGLAGLFVACVFSGALSTLSSGFNALAAVTWDDLVKRYFRDSSEEKAVYITKFIAAGYGVLSVGLAFIVGRLGTVLQASLALSGSLGGPLLALFCLALFCPFVNAKSAFVSLISGVAFSLFITIGTIVYPRPKVQLPFSVSKCPQSIYDKYGYANDTKIILPWEYQPEGINQLFHISYFYVPLIGFLITLVIGVVVSLLTGGSEDVDPSLLSPMVRGLKRKPKPMEMNGNTNRGFSQKEAT
jgi:SSS family transporter